MKTILKYKKLGFYTLFWRIVANAIYRSFLKILRIVRRHHVALQSVCHRCDGGGGGNSAVNNSDDGNSLVGNIDRANVGKNYNFNLNRSETRKPMKKQQRSSTCQFIYGAYF